MQQIIKYEKGTGITANRNCNIHYRNLTNIRYRNNSLVAVTNQITNTTNTTNATNETNTINTTDDTSRLANNYHIMTAIAVGVVIAIVIVFLLGFW